MSNLDTRFKRLTMEEEEEEDECCGGGHGHGHGHSHGSGGSHGHSHAAGGHGHSHASGGGGHGHGHSHGGGHGHSHGGQPCHGHHDEPEDDEEMAMLQAAESFIVPNKFEDKSKYAIEFDPVTGRLEMDGGISYEQYRDERQMPLIMDLITRDLSEPYSIYTYRYFIHNWPFLSFLVKVSDFWNFLENFIHFSFIF